jgi:hypothetical protein
MHAGRLWRFPSASTTESLRAAVRVPRLVELGQALLRPSDHALKVRHGGHADTQPEHEEEDPFHFRAPVLGLEEVLGLEDIRRLAGEEPA